MATYPNYNLNEPYEAYTDELKSAWDTMSQEDKTKSFTSGLEKQSNYRYI